VNTEGLSGNLTKSVAVLSNDPRQPQAILSISAEIEPEFALSERAIFFANIPRGKEATRELIVTIPPEKSLRVLSVESTDPYVAARLETPPDSGGHRFRIIAVHKADAPEGYHFGLLVIKTTSSLSPEIKVPVRGIVTPPENRGSQDRHSNPM